MLYGYAKQHPSLSNIPENNDKPDPDRLTKTFDAAKVAMKLFMFHVYFLKRFHYCPDLGEIADSYDRYYGTPSNKDRQIFQKTIKEIIEVTKWPDFFKHIEIKAPNPLDMTNRLIQAVRNSLQKKYHTKNTDFAAIHKSGVSKILLKGESYTCNTNLKRVYLEDVWGFAEGTQFLDASCLLYDFKNQFMGVVDWARRTTFPESIVHSGDQINGDKRQGTHTINIQLDQLPKNAKTLVFVLSAWHTLLSNIISPYILFNDPDTKQELCRYQFEDKATGDNTSVIMVKLFRPTEKDPWKVFAIGHIGKGNASNYDPIKEIIQEKYL